MSEHVIIPMPDCYEGENIIFKFKNGSFIKPCNTSVITRKKMLINPEDIKLVNFNKEKGTTVIKWRDNTITKVKVQTGMGDKYNPEMGMAMCICKKALGNKGNFNEVFKKWLPKED